MLLDDFLESGHVQMGPALLAKESDFVAAYRSFARDNGRSVDWTPPHYDAAFAGRGVRLGDLWVYGIAISDPGRWSHCVAPAEFAAVFSKPIDTQRIERMMDRDVEALVGALLAEMQGQPRASAAWWTWAQGQWGPFHKPGTEAGIGRPPDVQAVRGAHMGALRRLMDEMQRRGLVDHLDLDQPQDARADLRRLFECVHHMYAAYQRLADLEFMHPPRTTLERDIASLPGAFASERNSYQLALCAILRFAEFRGLRRMGDECYKELIHDGRRTCHWKRECSIADLVWESVDKETAYDTWRWLVSLRDVRRAVEEHLAAGPYAEFPFLSPSRYTFAFRNGVYRADLNAFTTFDEIDARRADPTFDEPVAVQFFDADFDPQDTLGDPRDIQVPEFDHIFEYQGFGPEATVWALAMIGRVLYEVSERDNWQVGVFFKGVAGSGKSTVGNLAKCFYPPTLVATLSSNGEDKFGLSAIHDKYLYVCTEVKHNFTLNQGDWQSMVTGEDVSVAIKYGTAISKRWNVPGILCGNELPSWVDSAGSVVRRLLVFDFNKKVVDGDPDLFGKLKRRIPSLLCKMNRLYLEMAERHGGSHVWRAGVLPRELMASHEELQRDVDCLAAFLASDQVQVGDPLHFVPEKDFRAAYVAFRKKAGLGGVRWSPDHYRSAFQTRGVGMEEGGSRVYRQQTLSGPWLTGVRLATQETSETSAISEIEPAAQAASDGGGDDFPDIGCDGIV